jgi:hypothetical protein
MFFTQVWGTIFGAFINYAVMIQIISNHRTILVEGNGSYMWTGTTFQSLNNKVRVVLLSELTPGDHLGVGKVLVRFGKALRPRSLRSWHWLRNRSRPPHNYKGG